MLTDENLEKLVRTTFVTESASLTSPPGLSATIRRRHTSARRRLALAVAAPLAVAAVAATIATNPAESQGKLTSDPSHIQLAGYTFTLPPSYGARPGSCELTLLDGTARTGIPGANGACAVLLDASSTPSWLTDSEPPADGAGTVWRVSVVTNGPEFFTFTVYGRDPATKRILVLAVKQPRTADDVLEIEDFEKVLNDGLAAARKAPN